MKILLIDDTKENLEVLRDTLTDLIPECEVVICLNPLNCIKLALKFLPDIIITDLLMPNLNGNEVCDKITSQQELEDVPIIVLSGSQADTDVRIKCLEAGADVFLSKPIDAAELIAQINAMFRLKKAETLLKQQKEKLQIEVDQQTKDLTKLNQILIEKNNSLRRSEQKLKASEERFRSIIENSNAGYFFIDNDGIIKDVNNSWVKLYKYDKKSDIVGKHFSVVQKIDDRELAVKFIEGIRNNEPEYLHGVFRRRCNDGSIGYHAFSARPVRKNSHIIGIEGIIIDHTEKTLIEEKIKENQEALDKILTHMPIAVFAHNLDGKFVFVNDFTAQYTGYTKDELMQMTVSDIDQASITRDDRTKIWQTLRNGGFKQIVSEHLRKDGTNYTAEINITAVMLKGEPVILALVEDITERKKAENKIQNLLQEKEMLLHEVHHRIKNNMASIESLFRIQSRNTKDEKIKTAFMDAISRLRGMRVLYNKLYRTDNFRETSLGDYLSDLTDEIINLFPNSESMQIKKDIEDFTIPANYNFPLCIMINELICNAMKYAFTDRINSPEIFIKAVKIDNESIITIRDNGIGMPEDFDLESNEGFGIKLVKMLSEQIYGSVNFNRNNGTEWTITFEIEK